MTAPGRRGPVIAIDGPAGAGKSTVARRLAARLGFALVPTGAMYRAVALSVVRAHVPPDDRVALREHLEGVKIQVAGGRVLLEGEDVSGQLGTQEIGEVTSYLTTLPEVRDRVTPLQRSEAAAGRVVLEGRDTTTVVCPDAEVKFFLTASPESRARRRHAELTARGGAPDLDVVLAEVVARDRQDTTRALAPLRKAPDAIELDTTDLSVEQVVERMLEAIERRCSTRS